MGRLSRGLKLAAMALPALLIVFTMRLFRRWLVIRVYPLNTSRLGHFAANVELYLCEREAGINVPPRPYVDLAYLPPGVPIANRQLALMWSRTIHIWPSWLMAAVHRINRWLPGSELHEVGDNTQKDRDVHNLLGKTPPHLSFTPEEEARGRAGLAAMGMSTDTRFICLTVRDNAYLKTTFPETDFSYHDYRDSDIHNYQQAVEALAEDGYHVIRMGQVVTARLRSKHPRVIDYASNGMRSDFMDVYLGAKCWFCISVGTGFDALPLIFRRPIAFVNLVPIGNFFSFLDGGLGIFKKHWSVKDGRCLSIKEIVALGAAYSIAGAEYEQAGICLIENSAEEVTALAMEMVMRLRGGWQPAPEDEDHQRRFWDAFPSAATNSRNGRPMHGRICARYGAQFLRDHSEWFLRANERSEE